jgi:arylsulfatase A-like enzyme
MPEATDASQEPKSVLDLYGPDVLKRGTFASNCLQARRLAERGVRFIQLYHPGWDMHGGLPEGIKKQANEIDQACGALITDLKQRDMLKDTLVVFGSEFGRTCYSQGVISKVTGTYGREHHRDCFTFWMAGGGIKPGMSYGETDEFGYGITRDPVHVNDFHATLLHQLGIDHERLIYRFQGRDYRLTDVAGKVVQGILA